jgi:hypothetical protein
MGLGHGRRDHGTTHAEAQPTINDRSAADHVRPRPNRS